MGGGYGSPGRSRPGAGGNAHQSKGSPGVHKKASAGKRIQLDEDAPDDVTEDEDAMNLPPPEGTGDNHRRQPGVHATPQADDFGPPTYRDVNDDLGENIGGPTMLGQVSHRGNLQAYQTNRRTPLGSRPLNENQDRLEVKSPVLVNSNKKGTINHLGVATPGQ